MGIYFHQFLITSLNDRYKREVFILVSAYIQLEYITQFSKHNYKTCMTHNANELLCIELVTLFSITSYGKTPKQ